MKKQEKTLATLGYEKGFSLLRLDGDMYQSTVDVLYQFYDQLNIGGYVIFDDWFGFPAKYACDDFFKAHKINPTIITIDNKAVYWKKNEEIDVQKWRYRQRKFLL